MKKSHLLVLAALAAATCAQAQLFGPPSASQFAAWDTLFSSYKVASDATYYNPPYPPAQTNGGGWSNTALNPALFSSAFTDGGSVDVIFLGETAGWRNDFGYTLLPGGAEAAEVDIQAVGSGASIEYLDWFKFNVAAGGHFDLWLFGSNRSQVDGPTPAPTGNGGKYYLFDQSKNLPAAEAGLVNYYWKTVTPTSGPTFYVVGFEDQRPRSSDDDFNDFVFAFRVNEGLEPGPGLPPVPEPSTYALGGAAVLLGVVAFRRFRASKNSKAAV